MTEHERVRRRLIRGYTRILKDCEQAIRDCEWWNTHRTECEPMDGEDFKVMAAGLRRAITAAKEDRYIDGKWLPTK